MSERILQSFMDGLPHLKDLLQEDVTTSVTDTEKFLAYYPGNKLKLDVKVGTHIPDKDPLKKTILENKIISQIVPKEVYGVAFKATTYPIRDSIGNVI